MAETFKTLSVRLDSLTDARNAFRQKADSAEMRDDFIGHDVLMAISDHMHSEGRIICEEISTRLDTDRAEHAHVW